MSPSEAAREAAREAFFPSFLGDSRHRRRMYPRHDQDGWAHEIKTRVFLRTPPQLTHRPSSETIWQRNHLVHVYVADHG